MCECFVLLRELCKKAHIVVLKNLQSRHKFYTTAGRDGRDKSQLCVLGASCCWDFDKLTWAVKDTNLVQTGYIDIDIVVFIEFDDDVEFNVDFYDDVIDCM